MSTTEAIVLSLQPHSDKTHILHAYTREHGRVNYKVYGSGKKNSIGLYRPLNIIQITAKHTTSALKTIRTANLSYVPRNIPSNPYKQAIALFLGEVLFHTLRHPLPDHEMFDFIEQSIYLLDNEEEPQNIHLQFLIGFAAQLGFAIDETLHAPLIQKPHSRSERQTQLRQLCLYLSEHVENWQQPCSLDILMEVFD